MGDDCGGEHHSHVLQSIDWETGLLCKAVPQQKDQSQSRLQVDQAIESRAQDAVESSEGSIPQPAGQEFDQCDRGQDHDKPAQVGVDLKQDRHWYSPFEGIFKRRDYTASSNIPYNHHRDRKNGGTMSFTTILTEVKGKVGIVKLNRAQAMNAFNAVMLKELFDALKAFDKDERIRVLIVTGSEKAFAAGADIKEMAEASAVDMLTQGRVEAWDRIRAIRKPVIAAVSGWALGGG